MIAWLDDVFRTVDQWSVDALEGGNSRASENATNNSAKKAEIIYKRSTTPTVERDELASEKLSSPPQIMPSPSKSSTSSASPLQRKVSETALPSPTHRPAYRERPEMLTPMESKWQKFLHSHNITTVSPHSSETHQLVLKIGIPSDLRAQFWQHCAGAFNLALKNEGAYELLLSHSCPCDAQIDADVSRTFSSSSFFGESDVGKQALRDVLRAYCVFDPLLYYCQGMSYIAAILLMQLSPEEAFWMMVQLIKTYQLRDLYSEHTPLLKQCLFIFNHLIESNFPQLHLHFEKLQITAELFASEWFTALFAISLSAAHTAAVWDLLMAEGRLTLFKVALALLSVDQKQLLELSSFDEVLRVLKQRGRNSCLPPPAEFLQLVDSQPLTHEHLRAMEQLYIATRRTPLT